MPSFEQFGHQVAVEIDIYNERIHGTETLRLCNFGPLFSADYPAINYDPRLIPPILIGTAISAETYGQPQRALPNQGSIEIALDAAFWPYLSDNYHWIGRTFRVYEGTLPTGGYVEDLELVYIGAISEITHDTSKMTIRTSDNSILLDVPMIADFYPSTALAAIAGKPRPQLWGTCYNIEPVLEDNVRLVYRVSRRPIVSIFRLRVGGVRWAQSAANPPPVGGFYVDPVQATITLGGSTLSGEVRCDVVGTIVAGVGDLLTQIINEFNSSSAVNIQIDAAALAALDAEHRVTLGYYTSISSINILNILDDVATGVGCWWGLTATGLLTAGKIEAASAKADVPTILNSENVLSAQLSQTLPPAWRVRVEYERHWQPSSQFFLAVTAEAQQRWRAAGQNIDMSDSSIKVYEPRALDVPTMRSVALTKDDGQVALDIFWAAWSQRRILVDVSAWIDPSEIVLYSTISLNYMMFTGTYRIVSAIRAVGGGPAQLQLWG